MAGDDELIPEFDYASMASALADIQDGIGAPIVAAVLGHVAALREGNLDEQVIGLMAVDYHRHLLTIAFNNS